MKNLSLWTKVWTLTILAFTLFPVVWYIYKTYIEGVKLLYETGITFMFFFGLAGISFLIWLVGVWVKSRKNRKVI